MDMILIYKENTVMHFVTKERRNGQGCPLLDVKRQTIQEKIKTKNFKKERQSKKLSGQIKMPI